jgi:hypothetical protein
MSTLGSFFGAILATWKGFNILLLNKFKNVQALNIQRYDYENNEDL